MLIREISNGFRQMGQERRMEGLKVEN